MSDNTELISSLAEAIEENDYLLTQILVRVPIVDVITFKRVSQRWLSLISAPYFSRCRATVQRTTVSGMILDPCFDLERELTFFYFDKKIRRSRRRRRLFCPKIPDNSSDILQSCNGLMLLQQLSDMFICNPTTGAKKPLPSPFPSFNESPFAFYSLAFDPLRFLGYKLICIFRGESSKEDSHQSMIYSSESGAWKHCGSSFSAHSDMDFTHGVYFKESVYWIGNKSKTTLRFDPKEECVKDDMPPLPPGEPQSNFPLSTPEVKEAYNGYAYILAPACGYMNLIGSDLEYCVRVFRLKEDYYSSSSSWVLMHNVEFGHTYKIVLNQILPIVPSTTVYSLLHLIEDGEDEMALLLQIPTREVIALRLKNNTFYDVLELKRAVFYNFPGVIGWYRAFEYVESLASL